MSILGSSHIVLQPQHLPAINPSAEASHLGNQAVLATLMPLLAAEPQPIGKAQLSLNNVDAYMLEETEILLTRLGKFCQQLSLPVSSRFNIVHHGQTLSINVATDKLTALLHKASKDPWLNGAFDWLIPNYIALAHSQELLQFSYAYEKSRTDALAQFQHFNEQNQGFECYVSCQIRPQHVQLSWCLESPYAIYQAKSISL